MSIIKIFDKNYLFDKLEHGESFRPREGYLLLIKTGTLHIESSKKVIKYHPSELIFFHQDEVYTLIHYSPDLDLICVSINREAMRAKMNFDFSSYDAYRLIGLEKKISVFPIDKNSFGYLWEMFNHLQFYIKEKQTRFRERIILNMISTVIYILVEHLFEGLNLKKVGTPREEELTMKFLNLLSIHYKTERSLSFFAESMNVSIKYLSICVKNITGYSPTIFIAKSTTDEAKRLLLHTTQTISTVAYELNFSDPYSFGKFFKKHTSLSPLNYRKKLNPLHTI